MALVFDLDARISSSVGLIGRNIGLGFGIGIRSLSPSRSWSRSFVLCQCLCLEGVVSFNIASSVELRVQRLSLPLNIESTYTHVAVLRLGLALELVKAQTPSPRFVADLLQVHVSYLQRVHMLPVCCGFAVDTTFRQIHNKSR